LKICLIEPYYTGSHAQWAQGFKDHSRHDVEILSLNGQYWKWRMHGGAVTLARKFMDMNNYPDLILATDMLDLSSFLALTRIKTAHIPTAVYFHENQLVYPWSPTDRDLKHRRDRHYGFINYVTALAADTVFFNSAFHRRTFLSALTPFLKHFPDHRELNNIESIAHKSEVLHLGLNLEALRAHAPRVRHTSTTPLVLWNHRWEYDKNPEDFFKVLLLLHEEGVDFEVAILGENFSQKPEIFDTAQRQLGKKIVQYGYADSQADYARWLWKADILPITSNHDFFGASVAEAIFCGCTPLLPRRLTYPELLPEDEFSRYFYGDMDELKDKLQHLLTEKNLSTDKTAAAMARFDWKQMAPHYDDAMERCCDRTPSLVQ